VGILVHKRPCPCGTGRPARDCCGRFRRLSEAEVARSYLSRQARLARDLIGPFSPEALRSLQAEAATLPARHAAFAEAILAAPDSVINEVRRMARSLQRQASAGDGPGPTASSHREPGTEPGAPPVRISASRADSPMARVAVAKALVALREEGLIDEHLAAAAVLELSGGTSRLATAALLDAAGRVAGVVPRPVPAIPPLRTAPARAATA